MAVKKLSQAEVRKLQKSAETSKRSAGRLRKAVDEATDGAMIRGGSAALGMGLDMLAGIIGQWLPTDGTIGSMRDALAPVLASELGAMIIPEGKGAQRARNKMLKAKVVSAGWTLGGANLDMNMLLNMLNPSAPPQPTQGLPALAFTRGQHTIAHLNGVPMSRGLPAMTAGLPAFAGQRRAPNIINRRGNR